MADDKTLWQEFRDFIVRGNMVDLAVAVVVGAAFGAVVTALVKDIITPIVAAIIGKPDFGALHFTIHKSRFLYGDFVNALITFLSVATAVFFFVVKPVNMVMNRYAKRPEPDSPTKDCPECLTAIPAAARRCFACTATQPA